MPIGGLKAIQRNLKYPEIARKTETQGRILVHTEIDENGNVIQTRIL